MTQAYYKEYYRIERHHWWFLIRNKLIMNHIRRNVPAYRPLRVLNVGVATGRTSELLEEFGAVKSVEYDTECYEFTKVNVPLDLIQGSILELPFSSDTYDLVCALDVIEHVEDHELAVRELQRVCSPSGLICVSVPAFMFLWNQHDDVNHHVRRYRRQQLKQLFANNGRVVYTTYFNMWLFFPIALFRLLSKLVPLHRQNVAEAGSDFTIMTGGLFQRLFATIFNTENFFVNRGISLPVGVSLLLSWQKLA